MMGINAILLHCFDVFRFWCWSILENARLFSVPVMFDCIYGQSIFLSIYTAIAQIDEITWRKCRWTLSSQFKTKYGSPYHRFVAAVYCTCDSQWRSSQATKTANQMRSKEKGRCQIAKYGLDRIELNWIVAYAIPVVFR